MKAPKTYGALNDRLIAVKAQLPKRLQQVAAFALQHPDEVALGPAAKVAKRAGVQASTLVRFAQGLGFAGFSDLQALFRAHFRSRWPDYSQRLKTLHDAARDADDPMRVLEGFSESAATSIGALLRGVSRSDLERALKPLAAAQTIYLLGQRRAFCVSHYLAYAMGQLGLRAALIDNAGGLGAEQLAPATRHDAVIAISFAPYSAFTVELAERAKAAGAPVIAITDGALSPLARIATSRFEVVESDFGAFRSLSATFCLAMTLAVATAQRRAAKAQLGRRQGLVQRR